MNFATVRGGLKVTATTVHVNRMADRLDCIVLIGKCDSTAWWLERERERELEMVSPLDFFLLFCFLDRAFSIMKTKINQQNAQINSGLIYY